MNSSSRNTQHYEPKKPQTKGTFLLSVARWTLIAIIGAFIFANIKPYEILATKFFAGIQYSFITDVLFNIPILGGILRLIGSLFNVGIGFLFWAFIQALELLPVALFGHGAFLDNTIARSAGKRYAAGEKDPWEVKAAKYVGNSLNTETLRFLILLGIAVYVMDFFFCLMIFPPVKGGGDVGVFLRILQTGQYSRIDWGNILRALTTVFAVEFLFKLKTIIEQIIDDLKD
jgi:hypothetical protein